MFSSIWICNRSRKCLLFLLSKLFTLSCVIPYVLCTPSSQVALQFSQVYSHTKFLLEYHMNIFFKNHPWRGLFCNVNLSNLENVLQRNLRTSRACECIFCVSAANFQKFSSQCQPWWYLCGFDVTDWLTNWLTNWLILYSRRTSYNTSKLEESKGILKILVLENVFKFTKNQPSKSAFGRNGR